MAIQILGQDGTTSLTVEATAQAARVIQRPPNPVGWITVAAVTGNQTLTAANGAIFSFRQIGTNPILIRKVKVGFVLTTAFTTAQRMSYGLIVARSFTASDTGGTAISITGNNMKHRTSLSTLTSVDCRIGTTAALTAGTKTLDTNQIGICEWWNGAVGATLALSDGVLFNSDSAGYPIILAQNEGINIQNLVVMGVAGVGVACVNIELAEVASY